MKLIRYKVLLFLHLLLDIVTAISNLSLQFQDDKISISQLQDKVNTLSSTLEAFKVRPGEHLMSFQQGVGDGNQFKGIYLIRSGHDEESFAANRDDIIDKATAFLRDRFHGLGHDPILHGAATLTDHHAWPINNRQQMLIYGEDAIQVLSEHSEALLNQNHFNLKSCLDEWMELKVHFQRVRGELQYNNNDFWKGKFQMRDRYPSLLLVIEVCLVIPVQTACCERGNSCPNRVMCDFRSTLDVGTVEALMRISLNGPNPLEYHSSLTVARWLDSGERAKQPTFMD